MDILKKIAENEEYMIQQRRWFHAHPELSDQEDQTIEKIEEQLKSFGIEVVDVPHGGCFGFIEGAKPGKTVLLRADVDALPVLESEENLKMKKVAVSENKGLCHACGHDGHIAMLLTAGKILQENKDEIEGRVILMFERGEEGTHNCIVLHKWLETNNVKIDAVYGCHLYAGLPTGEVALQSGPVMSGIMTFDFTIKGRGGHGSRPDLSISPIDCFVHFYNGLNMLRMKKISPFNALTFSVGKINCGSAKNIIPGELTFAGTVRLFSLEDGKVFRDEMLKQLKGSCELFDCEYEVNQLSGPMNSVNNDPELAELARAAFTEAAGEGHAVTTEPWMASESFAFTLHKWPGVFALVGIANPDKGSGAAHHNEKFDIDEDALKYGAAAALSYTLAVLASAIDTSERVFAGNFTDVYRENNRLGSEIDYLEGKRDLPIFTL